MCFLSCCYFDHLFWVPVVCAYENAESFIATLLTIAADWIPPAKSALGEAEATKSPPFFLFYLNLKLSSKQTLPI